MKKLLATAAALSLMLIACGDDSSSTGPGQTGGEKKTNVADSYHAGECRTENPCELGEGNKAYLVSGDDGYQIVVPSVSFPRSTWIEADFYSERSGDTLHIWDDLKKSDGTISMAQPCHADIRFDIPEEYSDVKYFKFFDEGYEVVQGPVPECKVSSSSETSSAKDPSSSETPESSSSFALPVESSSSVIVPVDLHQQITDASAQCLAKGMGDDPMLDGGSDTGVSRSVDGDEKLPPVVYRYVGTERTGFTIENLSLTCGVVVDTLDVDVSDDTVYVKAKFDNTNAQRCICNSKVDFAVENNEAYSHATVLVFNNVAGSNPNIMEIVDMSVVTVEEITGHKQAKDIKLECKNDRQTARRLAMASNTILPEKIDTTETASVAGRIVGDDGFDTIIIPEVMMSCGITFERFEVHASDGTLYVEPEVDPDSPITNCICPTRVTFRVEQNEAFSNTNYLVFGMREPMPLKNGVVVDASVLEN